MNNFLSGLVLFGIVIVWLVVWIALPWIVILALAVLLALWLGLTRGGRRTLSVTRVGVEHPAPSAWVRPSVIVVGIAGVVGVLVALLAMGDGLTATLQQTGSDDTAIVLRGGAGGGDQLGADARPDRRDRACARYRQGRARASRSRRRNWWSSPTCPRRAIRPPTANVADPRRRRGGLGGLAEREDHRGPQVHARHARTRCRRGRAAPVRRPGRRQAAAPGRPGLDRRRRVRLGRRAWLGVVGRFQVGRIGLSARQQCASR